MKKIILSLMFLLMSSTVFARGATTLTTYDMLDADDNFVGEVVIENNGSGQNVEHWVYAPCPWKYPDPTWYPDPSWFPLESRSADTRGKFYASEFRLVKSEDGYTTMRDFLSNIQKGERYIKKASVEIAPLPSP